MTPLTRVLLSLFFIIIISHFNTHSAVVMAQSAGATTASITGNTVDEQGATLVGATLLIKNLQTNFIRETRSDSDGSFFIGQLAPGNYEVTVSSPGFATRSTRLELILGTTTVFNFIMKVGEAEDIIEIKASDLVNEGKTESSTNNGRQRIDELPINMRNFLDFSLTAPRVTKDRTPQQGAAASSGISFNGQNARFNNITIDGLDNNDLAVGSVRSTFSQEAVLEFQVVSNSYSAEFGRALGGVVNIVTRSGSNQLHGGLFFLNRNDSLSSRNAFSPINPEFKQYQFGATLGGPIKRDKAFFFTSFERLSVKQNNIVTIANDTVSAALRQGYPVRNGPVPFGLGNTALLARMDARITPSNTVYLRYSYGNTTNGAFEPFGALVANTNSGIQLLKDKALAVSNTYINVEKNLVNETRFLLTRRTQDISPIDSIGPQINILAPEGQVIFGRGTLLPQTRSSQQYQIVNNTTLTRGRNVIKFGIDMIYTPAKFRTPIFPGGFAFFPSLNFSAILKDSSAPVLSGLQAFDPTLRTNEQRIFLMGLAAKLAANNPGFPSNLPLADIPLPTLFAQGFLANNAQGGDIPTKLFSAFFQNDYKLRPNLLIKTGVRYDLTRIKFANQTNGNLSPRIAFTYRPARLEKLNLHAAYGIFVSSLLYGPASVGAAGDDLKIPFIPFPFSVLFYQLPGHRLPDSDTIPPGVPFIRQLSLEFQLQKDIRPSYTQQTNLGFDYLLSNNTAISVNYDFVRGIRIFAERNINPIVRPIPGDPNQSAITGRSDTNRGNVTEFGAIYDSYFHSLTISFNRRLTNRVGFIASYTLSKAIDNFIDIRNELQQTVNPLRPGDERGLSVQDVRNRFIFSGSWDLSYTNNRFLRGFQLASIVDLESGRPYNLLAGVDLNMNGDSPPGDRPASLGRNVGITPGFANVDLRLTRTIQIRENVRAVAFIEAFNIFNRVNISAVNAIYSPDAQGNFNLPAKQGSRYSAPREGYLNAFAPRQFQFGLRFSF